MTRIIMRNQAINNEDETLSHDCTDEISMKQFNEMNVFHDTVAVQALSLLMKWVKINSYSRNCSNTNAMGNALRQAFSFPHVLVETQSQADVGDHYCFRTQAWDDAQQGKILLVGHHDTVFPPGVFERCYRQDDNIYGPGVYDMKGGIAVIYTVFSVLSQMKLLETLPIAFISVSDEELGSPHSRTFTEQWASHCDMALVLEPGRAEDRIITSRLGTGRLTIDVTGKDAHAGNEHRQGINAIWILSMIIDKIQQLTDYERSLTINTGVVSGGISANTVPRHADCQIDFRFKESKDGLAVEQAVRQIAARVVSKYGAAVEVSGGIHRPAMMRTEASVKLYERYAACAKQVGLGYQESDTVGGGSDANNIAALGIPVIDGLGPRGQGFHTNQEYIEASTVGLRSAALLRFLICDRLENYV